MPGVLMALVLRARWSSQKINAWASTLVSCPQRYILTISRTKRGGVEFIIATISYRLHWCDQYLCHKNASIDAHTPLVPIHWTLHPWSNVDTTEDFQRTAQSFSINRPRGVSTDCHWASSRQSTLYETFSVSLLSEVCSSRAVAVHPAHSSCMTIQRGVPFAGAMRKSWLWWRTHECPVCSFFCEVWRDTLSDMAYHFVWFLLPQSFTFLFPL